MTKLVKIADFNVIYNIVTASFLLLTIMIVVNNLSRYSELLDFKIFKFNSYI